MKDQTTFERVREILCAHFAIEDECVTEHTNIREDLGADSLDDIEIIMAIEEEFEFDLTDEEEEKAEKIVTVGEIVALIDERLK